MDTLAELVGESPAIVALRTQVQRLLEAARAGRRFPPVLVLGETGTGKGLLARLLHRGGPRAAGPFVDVNCAAIPETLLEAELFGFERGAFTDARQAKLGLFQAAHGGTLFLDEVGLLLEALQAKLLTAIESHEIRRLGSTRSEPVDAWIIAATSADLTRAMRQHHFREDLYHRLAALTLTIPPLRTRGDDILKLAKHFLARATAEHALAPKRLTPDGAAALRAYTWPGNVRELANVMERVVLLADGPLVTATALDLPVRAGATERSVAVVEGPQAERERLSAALTQAGGNLSRAAALLGMARNTLRYRLARHRIVYLGAAAEPPTDAAAAVEGPATAEPASGPPLSTGPWEQRRVAWLYVVIDVAEGSPLAPAATRALDVVSEKIEAFGGRVEETGPTVLLAVFGLAPVEDAARRAAHTAFAIQKAAERAGLLDGGGRIAIHSEAALIRFSGGVAAIGLESKRDAVRVVESLLGRAESGSTVVSAAAAPFLARRFEIVPLPALHGGQPDAYRLAGQRAGFELAGRITPFVGRRAELELLQSRWEAARRGDGQVIGVAGEPGIGKSRLLFEFQEVIGEGTATYLEGRCLSYGKTTPYLPIIDVVRLACEVKDGEQADFIRTKVRGTLHDLGIDVERHTPYLLHLLGVRETVDPLAGLSAEAVKIRTFEALHEMVLASSRRQPLVLAIEDLHWVDATSEEWLTSLVDGLAGAAVLVLTTYRSGYRPPWVDRSYATQIALRPLSREESLGLVRPILGPTPTADTVTQAILERAEGNPFFLEELAQAMAQAGQLHDAAPTGGVPETVQDVIMARIDWLADEPKRLLQVASVLGREFPARLLSAVWEGPGNLEESLRNLKRLEFIRDEARGDEPRYLFKHALTQEVAYGGLSESQRRRVHAAAARALEQLHEDRLEEAYERLAHHYARADQPAKAVEYLVHSAEKAARVYANADAVKALEEALVHAERLDASLRDRTMLDIVLRLAHSLYFVAGFTSTLELLLRHRQRVDRLQDSGIAGLYYFWLAHTYTYLSQYDPAVEYAERALVEAERAADDATLGKVHYVFARISFGTVLHYREGIDHGRKAVVLLERTGEWFWLGQAHWAIGINQGFSGQLRAALVSHRCAREIGETLEDPRLQTYADWASGWAHAALGDHDTGIAACRRSLERSRDAVNTAAALGWMGYGYLEKGDLQQAIPALEQAVAQFRRMGYRFPVSYFNGYLGDALRLSGEFARAREVLSECLELAAAIPFPYGTGLGQRIMGRIALADGDLAAAEDHFLKSVEAFSSVPIPFEIAVTFLDLGALCHRRGDPLSAEARIADARRIFAGLDLPRYVERAERLVVELRVPFNS